MRRLLVPVLMRRARLLVPVAVLMRRVRLLVPVLAAVACGGGRVGDRVDAAQPGPAPAPSAPTADACRKTGCSGELCTDENLVSPCIWKDEFACYRGATCARQADGSCGWTMDAALQACLATFR